MDGIASLPYTNRRCSEPAIYEYMNEIVSVVKLPHNKIRHRQRMCTWIYTTRTNPNDLNAFEIKTIQRV